MYNNRSKGFTLIELLVVIAIIGILSAVVLASLSTARNKGQDAAVQSDLATIQTQAEIYFGNNGNSYGVNQAWPITAATQIPSSCTVGMFSDPTIKNALAGAYIASGSETGKVGCATNSTGSAYVVAVKLSATSTTANAYWCVDSTGVARTEYTAIPTSVQSACP